MLYICIVVDVFVMVVDVFACVVACIVYGCYSRHGWIENWGLPTEPNAEGKGCGVLRPSHKFSGFSGTFNIGITIFVHIFNFKVI